VHFHDEVFFCPSSAKVAFDGLMDAIGDDLHIRGTLRAGRLLSDSTLLVEQSAWIKQQLRAGSILSDGALTVAGPTLLQQQLTVAASALVEGDLEVRGQITGLNLPWRTHQCDQLVAPVLDEPVHVPSLVAPGMQSGLDVTVFTHPVHFHDEVFFCPSSAKVAFDGLMDAIGDDLHIRGTLRAGRLLSDSTLLVEQSAWVKQQLRAGSILSDGALTVSGPAMLQQQLTVAASALVEGDLEVRGQITGLNLPWRTHQCQLVAPVLDEPVHVPSLVAPGMQSGLDVTVFTHPVHFHDEVFFCPSSAKVAFDGLMDAIGDDLHIRGTLRAGRLLSDSTLLVEQSAWVKQQLRAGSILSDGALTVAGPTLLQQQLTVAASALVEGDLEVRGQITGLNLPWRTHQCQLVAPVLDEPVHVPSLVAPGMQSGLDVTVFTHPVHFHDEVFFCPSSAKVAFDGLMDAIGDDLHIRGTLRAGRLVSDSMLNVAGSSQLGHVTVTGSAIVQGDLEVRGQITGLNLPWRTHQCELVAAVLDDPVHLPSLVTPGMQAGVDVTVFTQPVHFHSDVSFCPAAAKVAFDGLVDGPINKDLRVHGKIYADSLTSTEDDKLLSLSAKNGMRFADVNTGAAVSIQSDVSTQSLDDQIRGLSPGLRAVDYTETGWERGMVVIALDGVPTLRRSHQAADRRVFGVIRDVVEQHPAIISCGIFQISTATNQTPTAIIQTSGPAWVWVSGEPGSRLQPGDLLTTAGPDAPGYARLQADDLIRSSTLGKVLDEHTLISERLLVRCTLLLA
jgi:adhesin HecA-like repeat protein